MNNIPLISIVIPMFNAEQYIQETIESVLLQTYENWELIIVNNASTDDSLSKVHMLKNKKINIITLETNSGGPAKPRNVGVAQAKGEYIAFLDADDVWDEEKLEVQLAHMLENDINFSSTGKINIDSQSKKMNFKASVLEKIGTLNKKETVCDFIQYRFIFTSSVMIKKELMVLFKEDKKMVAVEDFCAWLEVFKNTSTKYKYIKEPLLKYRILETSISERHVEHKHATKAYLCLLNFIIDNEKYEYIPCFFKMCSRDIRLNFLQKLISRR